MSPLYFALGAAVLAFLLVLSARKLHRRACTVMVSKDAERLWRKAEIAMYFAIAAAVAALLISGFWLGFVSWD